MNPIALHTSTTSHGGVLQNNSCSVKIEGCYPITSGDLHTCPITQPSIHPPINMLSNCTVRIEGKPILLVGDSFSCITPCQILMGTCSVFVNNQSVINLDKTEPYNACEYSL